MTALTRTSTRKALIIVSAFLCLRAGYVHAQQDPLYNLYGFNQMMINPAYAGIYKDLTLNVIARKQWVGMEGAPLTNYVSLSGGIDNRFGVGGMVITDQLGINRTTEAQLAFSYKVINHRDKSLSFGVQGGYVHYRYDYNRLNLEYVDDDDLDYNRTQFSQPNLGAGIFYKTKSWYVGVSSPRLLEVVINDGVNNSSRYLRHFYVSAGALLNNTDKRSVVRLKPSVLWRTVHDGSSSLDVGLHVLLSETLWVGATYRNPAGMGADVALLVNRNLRVGYGLEFPTSPLISRNYGTHEISIIYEFEKASAVCEIPMRKHKFRFF